MAPHLLCLLPSASIHEMERKIAPLPVRLPQKEEEDKYGQKQVFQVRPTISHRCKGGSHPLNLIGQFHRN